MSAKLVEAAKALLELAAEPAGDRISERWCPLLDDLATGLEVIQDIGPDRYFLAEYHGAGDGWRLTGASFGQEDLHKVGRDARLMGERETLPWRILVPIWLVAEGEGEATDEEVERVHGARREAHGLYLAKLEEEAERTVRRLIGETSHRVKTTAARVAVYGTDIRFPVWARDWRHMVRRLEAVGIFGMRMRSEDPVRLNAGWVEDRGFDVEGWRRGRGT